MTGADIKELRTIIKGEISSVVDEKLNASEKRIRGEIVDSEKRLKGEVSGVEKRLKGEVSGVEKRLKGEVSGVEKRLKGEIIASENRLRGEISTSERRIINGIVSFISDHLMPRIDEKVDKTDMDILERRVANIESLPTVAHELKVKNNKRS